MSFVLGATALVMLLAGFITTLLYLYQRKQLAFRKEMEQVKLNHEKTLLQVELEGREQTLKHISREIHDHISLNLTLSKLHLHSMNPPETQQAREKLSLATELITEAIQNLRDIAHRMDADPVRSGGLLKALEDEIERVRRIGKIRIRLEVLGSPQFMEASRELTLFRILQETLNNILRHARARNIHVNLAYRGGLVRMEISDDGVGFDLPADGNFPQGKGAGLRNIRHRAAILEGRLQIRSAPGEGTCLMITVPLVSAANAQMAAHPATRPQHKSDPSYH